jgi:hypothetical protein
MVNAMLNVTEEYKFVGEDTEKLWIIEIRGFGWFSGHSTDLRFSWLRKISVHGNGVPLFMYPSAVIKTVSLQSEGKHPGNLIFRSFESK